MKIERLRNKKSKLIFLCGFLVVVVLLITLVFKGSKAKYRNSNIIPLINTKVKNNIPSFTTMGIYLEDSTGTETKNGKKYKIQEIIPNEGYIINETNSYCTKFNSTTNTSEIVIDNPELRLHTDITGNHSIKGIKKGYKCYIYFDKGEVSNRIYAKDFLLTKWGYLGQNITERPESDFTGETKVMISGRDTTNNRDWVYKAPDDDGTSYYLAGNPKYNWVKFGGHYWRIVRINGDGTIRMIYSGTSKAEEKGTGTEIKKSDYVWSSSHKAEYVGYWYKENQLHGLSVASSAYNGVNEFYLYYIINEDKKYIDKNAGFCNDRTLAAINPAGSPGFGDKVTYFAPMQRMKGSPMTSPILTCPDKTYDLFTAEGANKGNKRLANPIGMLTADEASLAGLLFYRYGLTTDNYLVTNQTYLTMTPFEYNPALGYPVAVIGSVSVNGSISEEWSCNLYGIRPVINLKKNVTFSKGDGSISSPFQI